MKKFLPTRGFTLVELMVVVAIIAILAAAGIAIFTNSQKASRDARRASDIAAIGSAMEQHFNQSPASGCSGGTAGQYCALAASFFASSVIPTDPLNPTSNTTNTSCNGKFCGYCIKVSTTSGTPPVTTPATAGNCANTDTQVAASQPPAGATYMICANLENATGGPGGNSYVCAQNQQQ